MRRKLTCSLSVLLGFNVYCRMAEQTSLVSSFLSRDVKNPFFKDSVISCENWKEKITSELGVYPVLNSIRYWPEEEKIISRCLEGSLYR